MNKSTGVFPEPIVSSQTRQWSGLKVEKYCLENVVVPEHAYQNHAIFIQTDGDCRADLRINNIGRLIQLSVDDVIILPMGATCAEEAERDEFIAVFLNSNLLEQTAADLNISQIDFAPQYKIRDDFIVQSAKHLIRLLDGKISNERIYAESLAVSMALHLLNRYISGSGKSAFKKMSIAPGRLRRVLEFIEENLDRNLSLAALAAVAELSTFHFARVFTRAVNHSPHEYVLSRRVELAKNKLRQTNLPIAEIALLAGFSNQQNFATVFRRRTGLTPTEFRALS